MSDVARWQAGPSRTRRTRATGAPVTELRTGLSTVALGDPDLVLGVPRPAGRTHSAGDPVLLRDGCGLHHDAVVAGLAEAAGIPLYLVVVRRVLGPAGSGTRRPLTPLHQLLARRLRGPGTGPQLRHLAPVADVVQLRPRG